MMTAVDNDVRATRARALQALNVRPAVWNELLQYDAGALTTATKEVDRQWSDEAFVSAWQRYAEEVQAAGHIAPLTRYLVQLAFPLEVGMENDPEYQAVTRNGSAFFQSEGQRRPHITWRTPEKICVGLHATLVGRLPFIVAATREDFVSLVCALTRRNEPAEIPLSMGASFVSGYRNWHRLRHERTTLVKGSPFDRFVLLSEGDYSAVAPETLGLETGLWKEQSLRLRLEHEGVHYATKRLFGTIRNTLHDELLADSFAVFLTTGSVRTDWLLHFFGLEHYPELRMSGRLANYRGHPRLSDEAFAVLARLAVLSISNIAAAFHLLRERLRERSDLLLLLASMTAMSLEEFALPDGAERMVESTLARIRDVSSPL